MKRLSTLSSVFAIGMIMLAPRAGAIQLLDRDAALKEVLGTADVETVKKDIPFDKADAIAAQIKEEAGRLLPRDHDVRVRAGATYYYPAGGEKDVAAVILKEPGKWGPIKFIVALDAETGAVRDVAVMSYTEKRGRPIARNNFLRQFEGNKVDSPIIIDRGVRGISGATVSSWAAAIAVRKAQLVYQATVLEDGEGA